MPSSDQNLLPGESYLNYRRRVLDSKSPTFCGAKWYYATIWLNSGMTTSCHHPLPHFVSEEEVRNNYKALSNTPKKKRERQEMKDGVRCNGCDYCWRIEDLGSDHVSDRVYKSVLYNDELLEKAYNTDSNEDFNLRYLEISFDRTCNLACSYCNPAFSSTWAKDIKTNGPYINLSQDGQNHYGHAHEGSGRYDDAEDNPYVQAFFKWWEADLHKTLTHLRLTGGEPLMSRHTWTLLNWFRTHSMNQDLYFAVNTNLMAKDDLIDRLLNSTKGLKNFHVYTSCENFGSRADYLRDGFEWNRWERNVKKLLKSGGPSAVHTMCTINAASVVALSDYLDWCVNMKKDFGKERFYFTLNILRFPVFQNILTLPNDIRSHTATKLRNWLDRQDHDMLSEMEIGHVERLVDYLHNTKDNLRQENELTALRKEFREFYTQYDRRRNKNFTITFPELAIWFQNL